MIGAVVTEFHLQCLCPRGQRHNLVTQTDPEERNSFCHRCLRTGDGIVTGLGIAWAVREKDAIGCERLDFGKRCLGGNHRHRTTSVDQHPQDVVLYTEVERDNMKFFFCAHRRAIGALLA